MFGQTEIVNDWELLMQFSHAYRGLSAAFIDQITMHRAQSTVLCKLAAQDGLTQSEIAQQLSVQGATVTGLLQRLEEADLVMRRRDTGDNRLVRVYLTEAGRAKHCAVAEQFAKIEATVFAGFTEAERDTLRYLLGRMLQNIDAGK